MRELCVTREAKQKDLKKTSKTTSKISSGECLKSLVAISSVKNKSISGSRYWLLVVDQYTYMSWSWFIEYKNDLADTILKLLNKLSAKHKITLNYIGCDNARKNLKLEEVCKTTDIFAHPSVFIHHA
jgi:hypothetical protein